MADLDAAEVNGLSQHTMAVLHFEKENQAPLAQQGSNPNLQALASYTYSSSPSIPFSSQQALAKREKNEDDSIHVKKEKPEEQSEAVMTADPVLVGLIEAKMRTVYETMNQAYIKQLQALKKRPIYVPKKGKPSSTLPSLPGMYVFSFLVMCWFRFGIPVLSWTHLSVDSIFLHRSIWILSL